MHLSINTMDDTKKVFKAQLYEDFIRAKLKKEKNDKSRLLTTKFPVDNLTKNHAKKNPKDQTKHNKAKRNKTIVK